MPASWSWPRCLALVLSAALLVPASTVTAQQPAAVVKLYVFDCGRLQYDSPQRFGFGVDDADTEVRELAVPCYVIEHPDGRLLWEGGLRSSTTEQSGWRQKRGWRMRLDRTLAAQLADLDLSLTGFDVVAFSHGHFDHTGAANEVDGATLLIQRAEYRAMFAGDGAKAEKNRARYARLLTLPRRLLDGEHDVFGDGRVRLLPAPGHTPGHQVLLIELEQTGPVVLAGDLYHFRLSRERRSVPTFNTDRAASLASMDRIEALAARVGAELWIGHDLAFFQQRLRPPRFYR